MIIGFIEACFAGLSRVESSERDHGGKGRGKGLEKKRLVQCMGERKRVNLNTSLTLVISSGIITLSTLLFPSLCTLQITFLISARTLTASCYFSPEKRGAVVKSNNGPKGEEDSERRN